MLMGVFTLVVGVLAYSYSGFDSILAWSGGSGGNAGSTKPRGKTMRPFRSEQELRDYLKAVTEKQKRETRDYPNEEATANSAAPPAPAAKSSEPGLSVNGKKDDSITNNQSAGVDEGDIVKVHGEHLVILRRGRLFTVRVGGSTLKAESSVNAYPPGINPSNDWYDEMLISGDTVVVIGYSYGRGGTEINLFDVDSDGGLTYRSTYHLRSNDYYSSRNYASRLIGNKLVFYTPQYLGNYNDPLERFPAIRKWRKGATDNEFKPVVASTSVYRPERPIDQNSGTALHTVTVCDLASRDFDCKGTAVVGGAGRVFYVSQSSVYVWTTNWNYGDGKPSSSSMLYRMPLDGSAPSALGVAGSPVDQFSFLESDDEHLNVLVRSDSYGENMWGSERSAGDVALFRTSLNRFSDGSDDARRSDFRPLAKPEGYTFQNRFVGDYLLYGTGNGWGAQQKTDGANLFAVNWKDGDVTDLHLDHSVDRIEQLGRDAVVVGTNGTDLYFSPVRLGREPEVRPSYIRRKASQGELRSHGFFYKPDGDDSGLLGLPVAREGRAGYRHLIENSAAILFLRNSGLELDQIGELGARDTSTGDACHASCVDWYGNARPIFLRGRIFALLGYELVEGSLDNGRLREMRRINYSPKSLIRVDSFNGINE